MILHIISYCVVKMMLNTTPCDQLLVVNRGLQYEMTYHGVLLILIIFPRNVYFMAVKTLESTELLHSI